MNETPYIANPKREKCEKRTLVPRRNSPLYKALGLAFILQAKVFTPQKDVM